MPSRQMRRHGFTLIEVITALALTAIVTAIASAAVASASDARATTLRHRVTLDAESRFRVVLTDMLRHAPAADAVNEPLLRIATSSERAGSHGGATLVFLSQGVVQPFGTGRIWRVTVRSGADGVELDAVAIGRGDVLVPLHATLPHRRGMQVEVLEAAANGAVQWRSDWPIERTRPALLRLTFDDDTSVRSASPSASPSAPRSAAPLVVELSPLSLPSAANP